MLRSLFGITSFDLVLSAVLFSSLTTIHSFFLKDKIKYHISKLSSDCNLHKNLSKREKNS